MPQSVTIISNRQKNPPDSFKLLVDGHELTDIVSYELKESAEQYPTLTVTMQVFEAVETHLEARP